MSDEIIGSTVDRIEDEDVLFYFKDKKALLYVSEASVRVAVRKILAYLGFQTQNIIVPDSLFTAEGSIDNQEVNLVITSDNVGKDSGLTLMKSHMRSLPNRMHALFCLIVSYQSMVITPSDVLDQDIEMLITKPFSADDLQQQILDYFNDSIHPSEIRGWLEEGKESLFQDEVDPALEKFERAHQLDPDNVAVLYQLGKLWRAKKDDSKSLDYFMKALKVNGEHRKSLLQAIELLVQDMDFLMAQKLAMRFINKYPLSPQKIPEFLKIAILTKSYDSVMKYCEMAQDSPPLEDEMTRKITAGLAVGAKELISAGKRELALDCLYQASKYCIKFPKILTSVVGSYIVLGEMNKADHLLSRIIEDENAPIEKHVLNLEIIYKVGDVQKALLLALALLQKKVTERKVFEIAIEGSIRLNRNQEAITELIQDACVHHPDLESYYKKL